MRSTSTADCRCKVCGALLAKLDCDGLTIRRGFVRDQLALADGHPAVTRGLCR